MSTPVNSAMRDVGGEVGMDEAGGEMHEQMDEGTDDASEEKATDAKQELFINAMEEILDLPLSEEVAKDGNEQEDLYG